MHLWNLTGENKWKQQSSNLKITFSVSKVNRYIHQYLNKNNQYDSKVADFFYLKKLNKVIGIETLKTKREKVFLKFFGH